MSIKAQISTRCWRRRPPEQFEEAVTTTYNNILATDPAARAAAVANEIASQRPDLVSLQEVFTLSTSAPATTTQFDYLPTLLSDLNALGRNSTVVATLPELDATAPSSLGFDVSVERGDAILVNANDNATITSFPPQHYATNPPIPSAVGPIQDLRGYAAVDVSLHGAQFQFVTTHLNTYQPAQLAQMQELLAAENGTQLPLIMAGDFNSDADNPQDPTYSTYQAAIAAGFVDAWKAANGNDPGYTCCQDQNLMNNPSALSQRIDLMLLREDIGVDDAQLVGDQLGDRTPSGLWPADHAETRRHV